MGSFQYKLVLNRFSTSLKISLLKIKIHLYSESFTIVTIGYV